METVIARGALAGWKRRDSGGGILLTVEVARSLEAFHSKKFDTVELALNDRQLRSLARDLERAARGRGLNLRPRKRLGRQMARLLPERLSKLLGFAPPKPRRRSRSAASDWPTEFGDRVR